MSRPIITDECYEVLTQYNWQGTPRIIPGPSGMNNITFVIEDDAKKVIVRLYSNHANLSKLQFEHYMLNKLQQAQLPIATPSLIANKQQSTITMTASGKFAAAFQFIEGVRPSIESHDALLSLAKASAELSLALSDLDIDATPAYTPYYELANNYPPLNDQLIRKLLIQNELIDLELQLRQIQHERTNLEKLTPQFQALPHQWIHGDMNTTNSLAIENEVVALLDFEFVTRDLRAMELAVLVTEIIRPETAQLEQKLHRMIEAFHDRVGLNNEELALLPQLIKLRSVDVVMHFIDRYLEGIDSSQVLRKIIEDAYYVITQMNAYKFSILQR